MADVTLSYKGSDILELSNSGSATLKTGGKYCEDDIGVEYVKPSGGGEEINDYISGTITSIKTDALTARSSAFIGCINLVTAVFTKLSVTANNMLNGCTSLTVADFVVASSVAAGMLQNSGAFNTFVLRKSNDIVTLQNTNAFNRTPFASGGTGGTIYIPKALYDHLGDGTALDYKSATNWSTIDGYGTITWAKIEGSYYETHYADGTVIS